MKLSGLELIKAYREHPEDYYPLLDCTWQTPPRDENGEVNIGWNAGLIGENRPFFVTCWASEGITTLSIYVSSLEIEDVTPEELTDMLLKEQYFRYRDGSHAAAQVDRFGKRGKDEFFLITVTVGVGDRPAEIEGAQILPWYVLNDYNRETGAAAGAGEVRTECDDDGDEDDEDGDDDDNEDDDEDDEDEDKDDEDDDETEEGPYENEWEKALGAAVSEYSASETPENYGRILKLILDGIGDCRKATSPVKRGSVPPKPLRYGDSGGKYLIILTKEESEFRFIGKTWFFNLLTEIKDNNLDGLIVDPFDEAVKVDRAFIESVLEVFATGVP